MHISQDPEISLDSSLCPVFHIQSFPHQTIPVLCPPLQRNLNSYHPSEHSHGLCLVSQSLFFSYNPINLAVTDPQKMQIKHQVLIFAILYNFHNNIKHQGFGFFFFLRFYLFIHERHREKERQRCRQREKQDPHREPDVGLDPGTPGSCPGPKASTQPLSHPGVPMSGLDACPVSSIPSPFFFDFTLFFFSFLIAGHDISGKTNTQTTINRPLGVW